MRKLALVVMCAVFVPDTFAASQEPALPNTFPTMAACADALRSGAFRFYEPRYFGLHDNDPANGADRVVVPLESDTCLEMLVVGGRRFVVQREGTLFRAYRAADGSLALYARNDCGNPVYGIALPPPAPEPVGPETTGAWKPLSVPVPGPDIRDINIVVQEFTLERDREPAEPKKGGFCSSAKCRWTLGIIGAAAAGTAAWYYWPCPPGTARR